MPYDGSGNFTRVHDWTADEGAGIKVRADRFDAENDDFATAFENCLTRDGQGKPSANIDWNNKKITNLAAPTTLDGATNLQTVQENSYKFIATTGSANAYVASLAPNSNGLVDGMKIFLKVNFTNTGASTLNVDTHGAKAIQIDGNALVGGELQSGQIYGFIYDLTNTVYELDRTSFATNAETVAGIIATKPTTPAGVEAAIATNLSLFGGINGLQTENDTDTDHDIKINEGICVDSTKSVLMNFTSSTIVKRIDANWVAGTGNGGFPSGESLSPDTWYNVFLIAKTDGTIDAGYDPNLDASSLLTDASTYTYYRRIGAVLTDASSNILQFKQVGDWFYWQALIIDNSVTLSTTAQLLTMSSPLGVNCLVNLFGNAIRGGAANAYLITSPYQTDVAVDSTNGIHNLDSISNENRALSNIEVLTNTSSQVRFRAEFASSTFKVGVFAYKDFRGKDNL